jgi:hypothetical protein
VAQVAGAAASRAQLQGRAGPPARARTGSNASAAAGGPAAPGARTGPAGATPFRLKSEPQAQPAA